MVVVHHPNTNKRPVASHLLCPSDYLGRPDNAVVLLFQRPPHYSRFVMTLIEFFFPPSRTAQVRQVATFILCNQRKSLILPINLRSASRRSALAALVITATPQMTSARWRGQAR